MTLDGFLPETDNVLTQWAMNHKKGFVQWRERCNARILPHSILDLLCEKDSKSDSFTYLAEVHDAESLELLRDSSITTLWKSLLFTCFLIPPAKGFPYRPSFPSGNGSCIRPLLFPTASAA